MKKIILASFAGMSLYAAVATSYVQPDYSRQFPTEEEVQKNSKDGEYNPLIGDDTLPKEKIEFGLGYESEVGTSNLKREVDESGAVRYKDITTGKDYDISQKEMDKEYQELQKERHLDTQISSKDNKKFKDEQKKKIQELGYTSKHWENQFLHGMDANSSGTSILNRTILGGESDAQALNEEDEKRIEDHNKASQFYQDNFSYSQTNNLVQTFRSNSNAARLADAYNLVEDFKAQLNAKYSDKGIKCFISRELIPAYFCPMINKDEIMFGGDDMTKDGEAMKECGDNCRKEHTCIEYNILKEKDVVLKKESFSIYPISDRILIESSKLNTDMQIENAQFEIRVTKSENFKGTDEEFEEYLQNKKPKFRLSAIKDGGDLSNPNLLMIDREIINVNSSHIIKKININDVVSKLNLIIYKPYVYDAKDRVESIEKEVWENIANIEISGLKAQYKSKDLYFCPFRQLVDKKTDCVAPDGSQGEILTIKAGSQVYNICLESKHKVGPNRRLGAFFTDSSCSQNCVESEDCRPTYEHYKKRDDQMFRVTVGCVDEEDNTACTKEKCEKLINDQNIMPHSEWVVKNDDERMQTVMNKAQMAGVIRPKFSLADELGQDINYDEVFRSEMKDAAYVYMIQNHSLNRLKYKIGEESPRQMAYHSDTMAGAERLSWILKPKSFDVDNGKTYNLYVVVETEQIYHPVSGVFLIKGQYATANGKTVDPIQFVDKTYSIKLNPSLYPGDKAYSSKWKVFRKEEFVQSKKTFDVKKCFVGRDTSSLKDGPENIGANTYEYKEKGYYDNRVVPSNCIVYPEVAWLETPENTVVSNGFYSGQHDAFLAYDPNQKAEVFKTMKFSSDTMHNRFIISDFMQYDLDWIDGNYIRTQVSQEHDKWFRKIYNEPYGGDIKRGWPKNFKVYAFYSDKQLSYSEVLKNLTNENTIYEKLNPHIYQTRIYHDGEINNNIQITTMGAPSNTTINVKTEPYLREEGKRVFKYMFLYDDPNKTDIFGDYIQNMQ